jgi:hypothetical protein
MRPFFRKHGNSVFYIILPVFFLLITVALIQLTPKSSRSITGDPCQNSDQCCDGSACGVDAGEGCFQDSCHRTNIGCADGSEPIDEPASCTCPDGSACIVCNTDEVVIDGVCERACAPGEDESDGCVAVSGDSVMGTCALVKGDSAVLNSTISFYGLALLGCGIVAFTARRKNS